jgi:hypothetical protein
MGTLSSLSQIRSIFTTGSSALAVGGQFMAGTMSSANAAGTIAANMTGTGIDGLLASNGAFGTAGTTATTIGSAATMMGGALVGFMAGKMISGGYSAIGKSGNTAVAVGTAIGAVVGGPIGAAIGGALGGSVNRLFGRKAPQVTGEGIQGTFSTSGADVQSFQNWFAKGGMFRSSKSGTNFSAISGEMDQTLDQALVGVTNATKTYAQLLGLSTSAIEGFSKQINISLMGLDAAGQEKAITAAIAGFGDDLAKQLLGTFETVTTQNWIPSDFVRDGESAAQALERLGGSLAAVNAALSVMNQTLLATSLVGGDAASKLLDVFGGVEKFTQATGAYYLAIYSETERNAKATEQLTTSLKGLGLSMPDTLAGFRAMVDAQDLTTDSGRKTYAALIALSPAFAQVTNAAGALAAKLGKVVAQAVDSTLIEIDRQVTASQSAANAARQAAEAYRSAGQTLQDTARDILMGVGDVAQNTAREYQRVLALARGGDLDAMGRLPGAATAMLADQRNQATTRVQAMLQAAQAAVDLAGVAAAANTAATAANYQAKLFDVNTAMLEVLRVDLSSGDITNDLLRQHLTALGNIGDLITGSQNLTVATYKDESGLIRAGLVDNGGRVVAGLDSTTAMQLQGMMHQSSSFSGSINGQTGAFGNSINGQTIAFGNSITGQTATFGALSKEQVLGLEKVENETSTVADITDIVARATGNNEMLSLAILRQLQVPDAGSNFLSQTLVNGNSLLAGRLDGVIAAINKQSEANQAEIKRQQDLVKAQKEIESFFQQFQSLESQNIEAARRLAETPQTIETYLGRGGKLGTGRRRYRTDTNEAYAPALAAAQAASQAAESAAKQLEAMRQAIRDLGGVPAFAAGGMHAGGIRLVGENGPELEVTGPARYYSAAETSRMMSGSSGSRVTMPGVDGMVDELRALRKEVSMLRDEARATAINTGRTQDIMKRITKNGESMVVSTDGEALEVTAP